MIFRSISCHLFFLVNWQLVFFPALHRCNVRLDGSVGSNLTGPRLQTGFWGSVSFIDQIKAFVAGCCTSTREEAVIPPATTVVRQPSWSSRTIVFHDIRDLHVCPKIGAAPESSALLAKQVQVSSFSTIMPSVPLASLPLASLPLPSLPLASLPLPSLPLPSRRV